jgi:outer membrane protein OmpA-like peptidoglycan-associated protein
MNRRTALWIALAALLVAISIGCSTSRTIDSQINTLRAQLAEMREQGAPICTPREYAAAEAHLDFAREEWGEREYIGAQDHLAIVRKNIEASKKWLENCVEKVPPDADGDGVLDPDDACPNEPGPKENKGCPWPDADKDGVPDNVDKCPNDPGPKEAEGCPDTDKDGLPDNVDKCPKDWGPKDNNGCPKNVKITGDAVEILQKIQFDTNKSDIKPESYPVLDEVVAVLKAFPTWKIEVQGHTDSQGGRTKNMKLSQARAESCRQYLIQHGIEASRLTSTGYGPDRPIASNNTPVGREKNRRTEFKIVSK